MKNRNLKYLKTVDGHPYDAGMIIFDYYKEFKVIEETPQTITLSIDLEPYTYYRDQLLRFGHVETRGITETHLHPWLYHWVSSPFRASVLGSLLVVALYGLKGILRRLR